MVMLTRMKGDFRLVRFSCRVSAAFKSGVYFLFQICYDGWKKEYLDNCKDNSIVLAVEGHVISDRPPKSHAQ